MDGAAVKFIAASLQRLTIVSASRPGSAIPFAMGNGSGSAMKTDTQIRTRPVVARARRASLAR